MEIDSESTNWTKVGHLYQVISSDLVSQNTHLYRSSHPIPFVSEVGNEADQENYKDNHATSPKHSDEDEVLCIILCFFFKNTG